ncbi:holo-ACP synthase [Treponema sp.]|uniref:holo-ACP synthase n=1 Tax=Treponema sp. TaxID=166 RepID=UPI00388DB1DF
MIFGIGTDIVKVSRFEKWLKNPEMIQRFFNKCEILPDLVPLQENKIQALCEYYAARFASKEAFSKALGTGFAGLELSDFGIIKDENGKPDFYFGEKTSVLIQKKCGNSCKVHVSISHEKEFAVSFVMIEKYNQAEGQNV